MMSRPIGSRPAPFSRSAEPHRTTSARADDGTSVEGVSHTVTTPYNHVSTMSAQHSTHHRAKSSIVARSPFAGRPLARTPEDNARDARKQTSFTYMENGTRWMERQEVKSLSRALHDMDLADEKRMHQAAQDEAASLVWKHQHPNATYANPDLQKDYRSHLRKGSYHQAHSTGAIQALSSRSSSSSSQHSSHESSSKISLGKRKSMEMLRRITPPSIRTATQRQSSANKPYGQLAEMVRKDIVNSRRTSSGGSRRAISGSKKGFMHPDDKIWEDEQESTSTSKLFERVPDLKPTVTSAVPSYTRKNPFARVRLHHDKLERSNSAPLLGSPSRTDSSGSSPAASLRNKDPVTSLSEDLLPTLSAIGRDSPSRESLEVRSSEIRAATSKRRSDRSPNLPQPTIVSDRFQRPIVSFQPDMKMDEVVVGDAPSTELNQRPGSSASQKTASRPRSSASTIVRASHATASPVIEPPQNDARHTLQGTPAFGVPNIPTICLPDEEEIGQVSRHAHPARPQISVNHTETPRLTNIPTICLPDDDDLKPAHGHARPTLLQTSSAPPLVSHSIPTISVDGVGEPATTRPLPVPHQSNAKYASRPKSTPHYSPSIRQAGILCAHCALPIAGRVLSAAGQRFHPGCFVCHQCHTNLELVAFYPEPETKRDERVARIRARQAGQYDYECECEATALAREADDGDESLRFFCHLDFHEIYSPRCKSCKTPIEGEVIVACGAEWHAGHFFCAQCGDPFDSTTPFVEKEGYAWCVGCHTNRYSSKCRKCKKPVTDVVVKALGADWHGQCFCCMECNGPFDDGRYFLRGESQEPVCVRCEERRLKA